MGSTDQRAISNAIPIRRIVSPSNLCPSRNARIGITAALIARKFHSTNVLIVKGRDDATSNLCKRLVSSGDGCVHVRFGEKRRHNKVPKVQGPDGGGGVDRPCPSPVGPDCLRM